MYRFVVVPVGAHGGGWRWDDHRIIVGTPCSEEGGLDGQRGLID